MKITNASLFRLAGLSALLGEDRNDQAVTATV